MSENILEFTEQNWESDVLGSAQPVLVDFWAPWCAPCRQILPTIEALAQDYSGRLKVGKLNIDANSGIAGRYGVRSVPTLIVFKAGRVVDQRIGLANRAELTRIVEAQLETPAGN